jgi:hypothetical protein
VSHLTLIRQNLTTSVVHIKVHLVTLRELFHEASQLFESVEQLDTPSTIIITRLYQPHIASVIHRLIRICEHKVTRKHVFIFAFILIYKPINFIDRLLPIFLRFYLHLLVTIEVLAKSVHFVNEILGR